MNHFEMLFDRYMREYEDHPNVWCSRIDTVINPAHPNYKYVQYRFNFYAPKNMHPSSNGCVFINDTVDELTIDTDNATVRYGSGEIEPSTFVRFNVRDKGSGTTAVGFLFVDGEYIYSPLMQVRYEDLVR